MDSRPRIPKSILAATALFTLVLISIHMTAGLFARYTAGKDLDNTARVAKFSVSATADEVSPVSVTADGTDENGVATYTVTVKNDGETPVRYEAVVNFTGEKATENQQKIDDSDDKLTFSGYLDPKAQAQEQITLDMSAFFETNDKYSTLSNDDISGESGDIPFEVLVTFTQVN